MNKKIVLAGGTGFLGESLAEDDVGGVAWGQEINQHIHHLYLMYQEEEQLVIY